MADLLDLQFLFVAGKGGVGRTTTSAALALAAARRGKRVLVAMCNCKERLSDLLGVDRIGHDVVTIAERIDAVNMTPEKAISEYGLMVLKVKAVYKAVFENRLVRAFLRGTPGLDAWSMLGKAYHHATAETDGRRQYDLVIVDGPATGHALDMLRVPKVIVDIAPPGLLRREAEKAWSLFRDRERSGIVLVTLPEEMPVNETIELEAALTDLELPIARLVVNSVLPELFAAPERPAFRSLPGTLPEGSILADLADAGRIRALREEVQEESVARLRSELPLPTTHIPHLFVPEFDRAAVESISYVF